MEDKRTKQSQSKTDKLIVNQISKYSENLFEKVNTLRK